MSGRLRGVRRSVGPPGPPAAARWRDRDGALSLEAVLILPIIALVLLALVQVAAVITDVLLVHEAARAGARAAATSTGTEPVVRAAHQAAPELDGLVVEVDPPVRRDGDLARVEVRVDRRLGPTTHTLRASAVIRVEPAVGTTRQEAWR